MKINKKKSGILYHSNRNRQQKEGSDKTFLGYPIKSSYKYLGIIIDGSLSFQEHLNKLTEKIKKGMKIISIMKWKRVSNWKLYHIWMTYILPHFSYGALIF